jgi:rhamnose utilization protein RhaD (predicted bifunctional aldolase and dehydrogenase)
LTNSNEFKDDLALRVYTSRLLGQDPSLVLHGGGNASVKITETNLIGEDEDILYVKGSGWDLVSIEKAGFSPVYMAHMLKLAKLNKLSDSQMVNELKTQLTNSSAQTPSVETILHAILPFKYVDHTHEIKREDIEINRAMGSNGTALLDDGACVLKHCNAGAFATAGHGTALGVFRSAVEAGKKIFVIADETRPFLQGARLTAWEMVQ